jgi:N-acetyldiaminopimelate deacetylase
MVNLIPTTPRVLSASFYDNKIFKQVRLAFFIKGHIMIDLIAIRRHLHQIPELGLEEFETQAYLLELINSIAKEKNYVSIRTWRTAILVLISGSVPTKTVAWRADMDALPVTEETGLSYASKHEGRMHACGHDLHMTIALGLFEKLIQVQPKQNFLFLFQPAEENIGGAKLMYEENAFGDWLPNEFYALHVRPDLPVGTIATNTHTLFAGACPFDITFTGKDGHAAFPHLANDALVAMSYFVTEVQTIVSRNINPLDGAVVAIGEMHAGTVMNQVAGHAELHGTIRSLTAKTAEVAQRRVREIAEGVAKSFNVTADIQVTPGGWLAVENEPERARELMTFFETKTPAVNLVDIPPAMTGEDFGYLLNKIPGVMFWLGVNSSSALHSSTMTPDESAIPFAVENISKYLAKLADS